MTAHSADRAARAQTGERLARAALEESIAVKHAIAEESLGDVVAAARMVIDALAAGNKVLLFGNGGSAADAQHIAAELVGRFRQDRHALAAIALTTDTSVLTALANDFGVETVFARQVEAIGRPGDLAIAISTSGESPNVLSGVEAARTAGLSTLGLTGEGGAKLAGACDHALLVPSSSTARIQEAHITIGHVICELAEAELAAG